MSKNKHRKPVNGVDAPFHVTQTENKTPNDQLRDACVLCMYWKLKPDHGAMGVCREGPVYQDRLATDWCGKCRKPEIRT
jgi:hypothetical protein